MEFLKLGIIHMDVKHKEPLINRAKLFELNEKAALEVADIILNPEMVISGYSFSSTVILQM